MSKHHRKAWTTADRNKWRPILAAQVRAGAACFRCGHVIGQAAWEIDHRLSISQGGRNTADNLAASHVSCNRKHGSAQGHAKRYGHPFKSEDWEPKW